jgi:hypothetical protein
VNAASHHAAASFYFLSEVFFPYFCRNSAERSSK